MRVLHLVGSPTDDFFADLSVLYARGAVAALADHDAVIAHVAPDGSWRFPTGPSDAELAAAVAVPLDEAVARLARDDVDVALPHLFCRAGMTTYRALLELLGVPYVGNRPHVMADGADKQRARAIVSAAQVAVPDAVVWRPGERAPDVDGPVVVKPVDADNSTGVTLVRRSAELADALATACRDADAALVERYVPLGREVRCGVVAQPDGELLVLPLEEYAVDADHKPIRLAEDKLRREGSGELGLVAKDAEHAWLVAPGDPVVPPVADAARRAYRALGCRHYGLFDFRVDPDGRPWFLEAGLYCSFSPSSVLAVMAAGAGLDVPALFALCAGPVTDAARRPAG